VLGRLEQALQLYWRSLTVRCEGNRSGNAELCHELLFFTWQARLRMIGRDGLLLLPSNLGLTCAGRQRSGTGSPRKP